MMSAAKTIRKIRLALCLEQSEFADQIKTSKQAVWQYEKGVRRPRFPTIRKILELAKKHKINAEVEDFLT